MSFPILTDNRESPGVTFAEPGSTRSVGQVALDALASVGRTVSDPYVNPQPYADIFHAAERSMRLTGNIASEGQARAEAYDQRIKAAKAATGVDLENPERGGYAIDARRTIAQEVRAGGIASIDAKGGIPEYQRRIFDQKLAELQKDHPDLQFGDTDAQARVLARGATEDAAKATGADVNPVASLAVQFAGGLMGSRRDPLFVGSLFAGPTTAVGRTALARIASSSLFTGLYNAGVSAAEQPTVQDWRARIGVEHGVLPAMQDVGLAFLTGAIPGAGIQAIKESVRAPLQRVLAGHPEPGDIAAVHEAIPVSERDHAMLQAGEESVAADKATLTIPTPKDIPEPLHNDMLAAALKRADDPAEPSPAAVAAVREIETAAERVISPAVPRGPAARDESTFSLFEFLARRGGLRPDPELNSIFGGTNPFVPGFGRLIRKDGMALDRAREAAVEMGYLAEPGHITGGVNESTINHLLEAIDTESRGQRLYRPGSERAVAPNRDEHLHAIDKEIDAVFAENAIDPKSVPDKMRRRVVEIMDREQVRDPIEAYERAIMEEDRNAGSKGRAGPTEYIPGWDVSDDAGTAPRARAGVAADRRAGTDRPGGTPRTSGSDDGSAESLVEQRITEATPKSEAEAHAVADEALDDVGRNAGMTALRERMGAADAERAAPAIPPEEPAAAPRARGDVLDKVPWVDEEGRPKLLGAKGAAAVGERETTLSMLVRSCK